MGLREEITEAAEAYLIANHHDTSDRSVGTTALLKGVRKILDDKKLPRNPSDNTIIQYISYAANYDEMSFIVSGGRRGGYWIEKNVDEETADSVPDAVEPTEEVIVDQKPVTITEGDLYPLVEKWLASRGYSSKDVSQHKKGGKWGNPDVVGVQRTELLGAIEVEVVSCEVKLASSNWEQFIFEAVSHKRFCNRSWYVYRVSEDGDSLPKTIEYYCEKYRVGLVQLVLTDEQMAKLKTVDAIGIDKVVTELLDYVVERIPASYDHVSLVEKKRFIDRLGTTVSVGFND